MVLNLNCARAALHRGDHFSPVPASLTLVHVQEPGDEIYIQEVDLGLKQMNRTGGGREGGGGAE